MHNKLVVFDTNIYLNLYDYEYKFTEEILEKLKIILEQIWIPYQVKFEIEKNKKRIKENAITKYISLNTEIKNKIEKSEKEIRNILISKKNLDTKTLQSEFDEKFRDMLDKLEQFKLETKEEEENHKSFFKKNTIDSFIESINTGDEPFIKEKIELYKEGELRLKYKIPPGYKDDSKNNMDALGDFLIWKEIIKKSKAVSKDIIFVTNDIKEDWIDKGEIRKDLKMEFSQETNKNIEILTFEKFSENLNISLENRIYLSLTSNSKIDQDIMESLEEKLKDEIFETEQFKELLDIELKKIEIIDIKYKNINIIETFPEDKEFFSELDLQIKGKFTAYLEDTNIAELIFSATIFTQNTHSYTYDDGVMSISFEETEIDDICINLDYVDFQEELLCSVCSISIGMHQLANGDLICDNCTWSDLYEVCSMCGTVVESSSYKCDSCGNYIFQ